MYAAGACDAGVMVRIRKFLVPRVLACLLLIGASLAFAGTTPAAAQSGAQSTADDAAQQLAERYAPIIMLKEQREGLRPRRRAVPAELASTSSSTTRRSRCVRSATPTRSSSGAPSASDLFGLNQGFYLDFPAARSRPGASTRRDFWKSHGRPSRPRSTPTSSSTPSGATSSYLQYWFYWYFNDWNNKHESDWEGHHAPVPRRPRSRRRWPASRSPSDTPSTRAASAPTGTTTKLDARGRPSRRVLVGRFARQLLRLGGLPRPRRQ